MLGSQGELMLNWLHLSVGELVYAAVSGGAALLSDVCQLCQINGVYEPHTTLLENPALLFVNKLGSSVRKTL